MNKKIRKILSLVAPALIALSLLDGLAGCSSPDEGNGAKKEAGKEGGKGGEEAAGTESGKPDSATHIGTFSLQKGRLSTTFYAPGELIAFQQVDLYAKENSFVKKLFVDVGSEVREGQLLAVLEAPELASQLAGAQSRMKSQEAIYIASKANYDRIVETSKTPGTISQNDIDQADARQKSDYAQWEAAKAAYNQVAETLKYLEVRAPFGGVISARNVNTGAYVGPSGKGSEFPLFTLQEQRHLRLVVSVPEAYTGYLKDGGDMKFRVKALLEKQFTAKVRRLAGALDNRLRAERTEMDVYNEDKKLLPGMVAEVSLPMPARDSTFIVPTTAVVSSTERVFVIRVEGHRVKWVDVKKGREEGGKVEIYGDLKTGDELVMVATEERRDGTAMP